MRLPAVLLASAAFLAAPPGSAAGDDRPRGRVKSDVRVSRVVLDVQVTNRSGDVIPDLGPADFRVLVDGREVELESAEWVPADRPEVEIPPEAAQVEMPEGPAAVQAPPGRLLVLFFQTSFEKLRLPGLMRMANTAGRFLDRLLPTDRVAVVSYDSQLKLRQDFTADRALIEAALFDAIRTGPPAPAVPGPFPSIARGLDPQAARMAATVERGLALVAGALAPIPGAKSMLYFGWGLRVNRYPKEARDWLDALHGFYAARVSLYTLDVTDADFHTLEVELQTVSDLTGGTYQKTHQFPSLALDRVSRRLAGRYVLVFVKPERSRGAHGLEVTLTRTKGEVLARPFYED